jgi:hypothetical protein
VACGGGGGRDVARADRSLRGGVVVRTRARESASDMEDAAGRWSARRLEPNERLIRTLRGARYFRRFDCATGRHEPGARERALRRARRADASRMNSRGSPW